jgi:putative ABC transport system permease protein
MLSIVLVAQLAGGSSSVFIDLGWNGTVFGFTAGVSLLACLLFGLAPAMKATALSPAVSLKGGRGVTDSRERFGLRRTLVVAQVALSLVLLFGALLFTRTLYNLLTIDPGFDQDVLFVDLTHRSLAQEEPAAAGLEQRVALQQRLAALPGVTGVAIAENVPLSGGFWNEFINVDGVNVRKLSNFARVGGDFFELLRIPLIKGRTFDRRDTAQSPEVAIVNETFVREVLNGAEPLGRLVWVEAAPGEPVEKLEIVGVTRDTKYDSIRRKFDPLVQVAISQASSFGAVARFVAKSDGTVAGITPAIERAAASVNPAINVRVRQVRQTVRDGLVRERLMAALSGAFGALAGLLAAIGIYGVLSYTVTRRSSEIAIRLAMGARRNEVLRMVIADAGVLIAIGLVIGTVLAVAAGRAAQSLLFGLGPTDLVTVASAMAMLAAIGFMASYLPARRASRVDPMNVLRQE